jgi:hypothetical protein
MQIDRLTRRFFICKGENMESTPQFNEQGGLGEELYGPFLPESDETSLVEEPQPPVDPNYKPIIPWDNRGMNPAHGQGRQTGL